MNVINKLPLRKQIWAGFIGVLLFMAIVAAIAIYRLLQLQDQAAHIADVSQPAMLSVLELKANIQATTSLMGLYIINKNQEYERKYKQSISDLDTSLKQYQVLPEVVSDERMQNDVAYLGKRVRDFLSLQNKIDFLNKNFIENYIGIKVAGEEINPRSQTALQLFSEMIESEFSEDASEERRELMQAINNIRQNWMNVVAVFRTFLSNPNAPAIEQLRVFMKQHDVLMEQLNEKSDIFTFEQEEGIAQLNAVSVEYFKYMNQVFDIYTQGNWRKDVTLIREKITPIILDMEAKIDSIIDYEKNKINKSNQNLLLITKHTLSQIGFVFIVSLLVGITTAWFTCKQINTVVNEIHRVLENILRGDFSLRMSEDRAGDIGRLTKMVNYFSQQLKAIVGDIQSSILDLHSTAKNLTSITGETTENISQQNRETNLVADAASQMSLTSQEVASNTVTAANSAQQADESAKSASLKSSSALQSIKHLVQNLDASEKVIQSLKDDTNNISMVLDVIRDISEQTNLLALNAAIEAARAGEQGRGFAVVADEVRTLASRTQDSTEQIKELIDKLQLGAENAVDVMSSSIEEANKNSAQVAEVTESLNTIKQEIININAVLGQVASASEEQSSTSCEIANNISSISKIADKTSHSTGALLAAEKDLGAVTQRLDKIVSVFQEGSV